jgi:hypothetical protein
LKSIFDLPDHTIFLLIALPLIFGGMWVIIIFGQGGILDTENKRQYNYHSIDNSKNCIELNTSYLRAIDFENGYFNNGESVNVTAHEEVKAQELGCR